MLDQVAGYLNGGNLVIGIIVVMLVLFVVAIIRYLFDRSGGYF